MRSTPQSTDATLGRMNGILIESFGGPEQLHWHTDLPDLSPGPGECLVRTSAIGVNFTDVYQRTGTYPRPLPFTPGSEGAGVVVSVGSDVTEIEVGQRVAWCDVPDSYAEYVLAPASRLVPVPDSVDDNTAASSLLQGITAQFLATSVADTGPQTTALVTAGAGGVGMLLTQYLKSLGATVFTLVSTEEKAKRSRDAGADEVLLYDAHLDSRIRDLTDGRGVDVVFDGVGRDTFELSLSAAKVRGLVVLFGAASGAVPPMDPQELNKHGSLYLTRPHMRHFISEDDELRQRATEVLDKVAGGELMVTVGATYALSDAAQAHTDLQARKTVGAVVLTP